MTNSALPLGERPIRRLESGRHPDQWRALGLWADESIVTRFDRQADARRAQLAVADSQTRWSYEALRDISRRLAGALLELGVRAGDPVAAQLPTCALLPAVHLACNRIGALFLPISSSWRELELTALLSATRATVLLATPTHGDDDLRSIHTKVRGQLPDLGHVAYVRPGDAESLESFIGSSVPTSCAWDAAADAPGHVMVSSGSSGIPKASVWSSNDVLALVAATTKALDLTPDDIVAGFAPANLGSTGYVFPVLTPLMIGATSVLLERWSPSSAVDLLVREECTVATAVPAQLSMLLDLNPSLLKLPHLTRINNAGAPLPAVTAAEIEDRTACRVQTVYGASDGGVPVMTSITDPVQLRRNSVGRLCAGQEIELRDASGNTVATGDIGEVCWRGATKSFGYLNQPAYDQAAFDDDDWFCSGDLGILDQAGYLRIVGRNSDMILRGGTNIFPAEVERALVGHPDIHSAAVVGVPDGRLGERVCAVVVTNAAPTTLEIRRFLTGAGLARDKHPEFVVAVDELPVNAGGKVDRRQACRVAIAVLDRDGEHESA